MFNLPFFTRKYNLKPSVLVILDGFGVAPHSQGNAIALAKTPYYKSLLSSYPHGELIASGESVGLPTNEVGNTEVGHLTLGAGRTMLQDLKRINLAIEKGTFFDNKALVALANHCKANNSSLHVLGLVSSGNVHSSLSHLHALMQFCKKEGLKSVYLHTFTDGRDAPPKEAIEMITALENHLHTLNLGKIASVSGRYYAMDRDKRWERTEKAYKAIVLGHAVQTESSVDAVNSAYARGQTDEFIEPTVIADKNGPIGIVKDNDGIIFFNYRIDRPRQLTMAFVNKDFEDLKNFDLYKDQEQVAANASSSIGATFNRGKVPENLFFATMTMYHKNLPVNGIAFGPEEVDHPMGQVISDKGLTQLRMAESEKERFVTYYFNGQHEEKFAGEERLIVPSPKVATYDQKPEMSLPKLVKDFVNQIRRDKYNFAVINFANPDMVAHTGNLKATVAAVEYVDRYLNYLTESILSQNGSVYITADHGNSEELITFPNATYFFTSNMGTVNTDHSNNPVPFLVVDNRFKGNAKLMPQGSLADVAPTILAMMGIDKPEVMTGRNLLEIGTRQ